MTPEIIAIFSVLALFTFCAVKGDFLQLAKDMITGTGQHSPVSGVIATFNNIQNTIDGFRAIAPFGPIPEGDHKPLIHCGGDGIKERVRATFDQLHKVARSSMMPIPKSSGACNEKPEGPAIVGESGPEIVHGADGTAYIPHVMSQIREAGKKYIQERKELFDILERIQASTRLVPKEVASSRGAGAMDISFDGTGNSVTVKTEWELPDGFIHSALNYAHVTPEQERQLADSFAECMVAPISVDRIVEIFWEGPVVTRDDNGARVYTELDVYRAAVLIYKEVAKNMLGWKQK